MIYSRKIVVLFQFIIMKTKGAIALYRLRALVNGVGKSSRCPLNVELKHPGNIKIGDYVAIGPMSTIGGLGGVILEDHVRISKGVTIESAGLDTRGSLPYKHVGKQVHIKSGAWIGARAIILGGVTIGEKAIIGAGAIVTKDVPDNGVIVSGKNRAL